LDLRVEAWKRGDLPLSLIIGQTQRAAMHPESWTLRLVVSGSSEGLKLLAKHGAREAPELMVLPYVRRDGFRWWQACLGAFPNRGEAVKAVARLSPALRKALSEPLPLKLHRLPGDPPKGGAGAGNP
jgi:septal ring-binding cell division protein DamX